MVYIKNRVRKIIIVGISAVSMWMMSVSAEAAVRETKIHFIALNNSTDAILLESNGHYGLVDSGEDWEYPDGTDERYPLRNGITQGIGYEQQVIHYLKKQGVKKLDFYIATHSHSDHIGSGDEILDAFPTDRLYIQQYEDSYIAESDEENLWDNQYIYDDIIDAANRNGTEIITDLDLAENEKYCSFTLGDMSIRLLNVERKKDENGQIIPVMDENENCIVAEVTAFGRTALLTSDIEPTDGDTGKLANDLIDKLGDLPQYQVEGDIEPELEENYRNNDAGNIDETQRNTGKRISIDLMKMNHHSIDYNNTTYFLTSLNPKDVVITGYEESFSESQRDALPNAKVYATTNDCAAVIAKFYKSGIETYYKKLSPEWMRIEGDLYYFDNNGRTFTDEGVHKINGKEYCFDKKGAMEKENRWVFVDGNWKYWLTSGKFPKNSWLRLDGVTYYLDKEGNAVEGWYQIDEKWYYFNEDKVMEVNAWIEDYYVDASGVWQPEKKQAQWLASGDKYWYSHGDGSYRTSGWERIDGEWYYFDEIGWMMTGWNQMGSDWYYLNSNGTMATDVWVENCYLKSDGRMAVSEWVENGQYYVDEGGNWSDLENPN